jgi:putative phosphoribosyl transferase
MSIEKFTDRAEAGRELAARIAAEGFDSQSYVLALPRGGVPVAHEIATLLGLPLDVVLVRKLGVPGQKEVAMGAVASGSIYFLNKDVIKTRRIDSQTLTKVLTEESTELRRRQLLYRGDHPLPSIANRNVIVVDDGLATGATMKAALSYVRRQNAAHITVAVPVAHPYALFELRAIADRVICPAVPDEFRAVSVWYDKFPQVTDEEVVRLLQEHWQIAAEVDT